MARNTSYETILAVLKATGGVAIDDHGSSVFSVEKRQTKVGVIAEVRGQVVKLEEHCEGWPCFSFNSMYVGDDNMVHISTNSVGIMKVRNGCLEDSIAHHNAPETHFDSAWINLMHTRAARKVVNVTRI